MLERFSGLVKFILLTLCIIAFMLGFLQVALVSIDKELAYKEQRNEKFLKDYMQLAFK